MHDRWFACRACLPYWHKSPKNCVTMPHKPALICIYYPQQILSAITALHTVRKARNQATDAPAIMYIWTPPATDAEIYRSRRAIFEKLLTPFPYIKMWMPEPSEIAESFSQGHRVMAKAMKLRKKFGANTFSDIYYSVDVTGDFTPQSAFQAFPETSRISYGDAMGIGYTLDNFEKKLFSNYSASDAIKSPLSYIRSRMVWLKRRLMLPWHRLEATCTCMIIPCDNPDYSIPAPEQMTVTFSEVQQTLSAISGTIAASGLNDEIAAMTAGESRVFLILLGSFSESRLCSEDAEIALYEDVAAEHIPAGSLIIIKPHPAAKPDKLKKLTGALSNKYRTIVTPPGISDMPIEFLPALVEACTVLSFSYSSVSLAYLYGAEVLHVMTDSLISSHISPENRKWLHDSQALYADLLKKAEAIRFVA